MTFFYGDRTSAVTWAKHSLQSFCLSVCLSVCLPYYTKNLKQLPVFGLSLINADYYIRICSCVLSQIWEFTEFSIRLWYCLPVVRDRCESACWARLCGRRSVSAADRWGVWRHCTASSPLHCPQSLHLHAALHRRQELHVRITLLRSVAHALITIWFDTVKKRAGCSF